MQNIIHRTQLFCRVTETWAQYNSTGSPHAPGHPIMSSHRPDWTDIESARLSTRATGLRAAVMEESSTRLRRDYRRLPRCNSNVPSCFAQIICPWQCWWKWKLISQTKRIERRHGGLWWNRFLDYHTVLHGKKHVNNNLKVKCFCKQKQKLTYSMLSMFWWIQITQIMLDYDEPSWHNTKCSSLGGRADSLVSNEGDHFLED